MDSSIKFCTLGSGSKGNAFVITNSYGESILVDAGFSCKKILEKLDEAGVSVDSILAVLLTHDHDDHVKGCKLLCNKLNIPLYATFLTSEFLSSQDKLPKKVIQFEPGEAFMIGQFHVAAFAVQHDATDPVGFTVHCHDKKIGIATDLGELNMLCKKHLSGCHALVLESNYDRDMLYNSDRILHLKRRISSSKGHLDNLDATAALELLLGEMTKVLMLVHLSRDCNTHEIVHNLTCNCLQNLAKSDIITCIASQESISDWFIV